MPVRLSLGDADFAAGFAALLAMKREVSEDVDASVRGILADVARDGDTALISYTRRFDGFDLREFACEHIGLCWRDTVRRGLREHSQQPAALR